MKEKFDFVVIGSGPGGYVCANRAAQLGFKTAVIEKAEVGGICLNYGCIPTKALLESAHLFAKIKNSRFGIEVKDANANIDNIVARSRQIASRLSKGIESLFKKYKVTLFAAEAQFASENVLKLRATRNHEVPSEIESKYIVIATGARAKLLPNIKKSDRIWTYREALMPSFLPKSMIVVGSGAIGCEFADFYSSLGVKVTLLEVAKHILPFEEEDAAKVLKSEFEKKGIRIYENTQLKDLQEVENGIEYEMESAKGVEKQQVEVALLAVGVQPNSDHLALEKAGITADGKGFIQTNEFGQVENHSHIFAIGDVAGGKLLAHKASHEGMMAAEYAAHLENPTKHKKPQPIDSMKIPACIYTSPQVASIGMTKQMLEEKQIPFKQGEFPFLASGKALALEKNRGFARVYLHAKTGEILGAHFVGPDVTEVIGALSVAMAGELTSDEIRESVFPHPTISETAFEAVLQAYGSSGNI